MSGGNEKPMIGKVYLVGGGPGDPGLITVKGKRCIETADVIIYDYLVNDALLEHARPGAEIIYAGKMANKHTLKQEEINALLVEKSKTGATICRLKGGDPFLFGRGGEEAIHLHQAKVPFEVVPGISAAIAVPAYAGIPVTQRGYTSSFAAVTGHEDPTKESSDIDWSKLATAAGTLVFFMGVRNLPMIAGQLMKNGRSPDTPVALIRWGTTPNQKTVVGVLENIAELSAKQNITPPALIVVGEVVALRDQLTWFEDRALFGKRIVVTRARAQASDLTRRLEDLGADVVELPVIKIMPPDDPAPLEKACADLGGFDWVVFTSVNAVDAFFDRVRASGGDARAFAGLKICAIGPATSSRLEEFGLRADLIPEKYVAESIFEALSGRGEIAGARFLLPRANIARPALRELLEKGGGHVTEVTAYQTVVEPSSALKVDSVIAGGKVDAVTFTSSSTVKNFVDLLGETRLAEIAKSAVFASIGPMTSKTMGDLGIEVHCEAASYTIPGLVDALLSYFETK